MKLHELQGESRGTLRFLMRYGVAGFTEVKTRSGQREDKRPWPKVLKAKEKPGPTRGS